MARTDLKLPVPYPWRCLCRGLLQITLNTPLRRMTLQFSQMRRTDAFTFISHPLEHR
jgi:hypothetical protein